MTHADESKRMKLFGNFANLANRPGYFVDRNGQRIGGNEIAQKHEAPVMAPSQTTTTVPPSDAMELCHACPANGSCPSFCRTCGGGRTIIAPCPLGRW